jgi:hypothetical protein
MSTLDDSIETIPINNEKYMRGCINTDQEHIMQLDQYNLAYRCHKERDEGTKTYSDCIGYQCNRESNEFLYSLDEFNTYRNNPVNQQGVFCPKNVQLFNNWTKRNDQYFVENNNTYPNHYHEEKIPALTYNTCVLKYD